MTTDYTQTFEHDGHTVQITRGTVRSSMEARRLVQSLLRAYGHVEGNPAPNDAFGNFDEYSGAMSRTTTDAPWWSKSTMSDEEVRQRFELFLEQSGDLYDKFRTANIVIAYLVQAPALASGGENG